MIELVDCADCGAPIDIRYPDEHACSPWPEEYTIRESTKIFNELSTRDRRYRYRESRRRKYTIRIKAIDDIIKGER